MYTLINTIRLPILLCGLVIVLNGCTMGAHNLRSNRPAYNEAIQHTENEELLLNIVRVRYGEPIKFLQVASIVSTFNYGANVEFNAALPEAALNVFGALAGANYAEVPTVTYVPVEGEQFAMQMLQESSIDMLLKLIRSGWSITQAMPIMMNRIGPLSNMPEHKRFGDFMQLVNLLSEIQARGDLSFVSVDTHFVDLATGIPAKRVDIRVFGSDIGTSLVLMPDENNPEKFQLSLIGASPVMELTYASEAEANQVASLLGSTSTRKPGQLVERIGLIDRSDTPFKFLEPVTQIASVMRSFSDQLVYMASGVSIPPSDQGAVIPMIAPQEKLLDIRQSSSRPKDAFVAIKHHGHWFSIDKYDIQSKTTFALLLTIFSLQTTSGGAAPSLTLPIGG